MELESCPFCDGKAKIYATTSEIYPNHVKHFCYCEECHASGPSFTDFEDDGSSLSKAVEAWNKRSGNVRPIGRGKWEHISFMTIRCSNCKETFHELDANNFCPNCGFMMEES